MCYIYAHIKINVIGTAVHTVHTVQPSTLSLSMLYIWKGGRNLNTDLTD